MNCLMCVRLYRQALWHDETGSNAAAGNAEQARLQKEGGHLYHKPKLLYMSHNRVKHFPAMSQQSCFDTFNRRSCQRWILWWRRSMTWWPLSSALSCRTGSGGNRSRPLEGHFSPAWTSCRVGNDPPGGWLQYDKNIPHPQIKNLNYTSNVWVDLLGQISCVNYC